MPVEPHVSEIQLCDVFRGDKGICNKDRADCLAYESRESNSRSAHPETDDEDQIQDDVGQSADEHEVERSYRVSLCPEDRGAEVVDQHEHACPEIYPHVQRALIEDAGRGGYHPQEGFREQQARCAEEQPRSSRHHECGLNSLLGPALVSASDHLAHDDAGAHAQTVEQGRDHEDQRSGGSNRGESFAPGVFAHDDGVYRAEEVRKEVGDHERECETQDAP